MKRRDLLRHLEYYGCRLLREGSEHSIWENTKNKMRTSVPRHREIVDFTAVRICKQLDIANPLENKN
ncbi:MAG: type II toxin-antitoxin system HicA family toxin [Acidobacteriota bacterium]|jgi:predicted RNA binding protein YcfA (HicA-like mRNA interferase family)|nr:type II toxin-antitoxin system HicA family toxin [Acidobacteriota bacterium]